MEEARRKERLEYEKRQELRMKENAEHDSKLAYEMKKLQEAKARLESGQRERSGRNFGDDLAGASAGLSHANAPTMWAGQNGHDHYWRPRPGPPPPPPPEPRYSDDEFPNTKSRNYLKTGNRGAGQVTIVERDGRRRHRTPSPPSPNPARPYGRRSRSSSLESRGRAEIRELRRSTAQGDHYGVSEGFPVPAPYGDIDERRLRAREDLSRERARRAYRSNDPRAKRLDDMLYRPPQDNVFWLVPRARSPEEIIEDASEVEDAALDDEELKKKMLVKYTGGTATAAAPESHVSLLNLTPAQDGAKLTMHVGLESRARTPE